MIQAVLTSAVAAVFLAAARGVDAKQNLFHVEHRVSCNRQKLCNGNLMCAYVCEPGSVETDAWADAALAYQRGLQRSDPLVVAELPSTHNSAISEAYGMSSFS